LLANINPRPFRTRNRFAIYTYAQVNTLSTVARWGELPPATSPAAKTPCGLWSVRVGMKFASKLSKPERLGAAMAVSQSKPASLRARRNRTTTRAVLRAVANPTIPELPGHTEWHVAVQDWWRRAWSSPMAPEWTGADQDAMFMAARLLQQFWDEDTKATTRVSTAGEIRHLLMQCGLTPMSRRSLQWEIDRAETAQERTNQRRTTKAAAAKKAPDPRTGMHAVS
jgi:hypothetical protein